LCRCPQSPAPGPQTPVQKTPTAASVQALHTGWSSPDTVELYPADVPSPRESQLQLWHHLSQLPLDDQLAGRAPTPPPPPREAAPVKQRPADLVEPDRAIDTYDLSVTDPSEDFTIQSHCSPGFQHLAREREFEAQVRRLRKILGMKTPPRVTSPPPSPPRCPSPPPQKVTFCDEDGNSLAGLDAPLAPARSQSSQVYYRNVPCELMEMRVCESDSWTLPAARSLLTLTQPVACLHAPSTAQPRQRSCSTWGQLGVAAAAGAAAVALGVGVWWTMC
jgi:hypothetical protein